ncbi:hypothetical protein [Nocardioides convexus]|uniref:hypothetical protein n=1 Tax=Nocardioides convexus TaxID=2712224 RepID=UPI0024181E13|nr:hypothetical protein [Nocardioides convexus]
MGDEVAAQEFTPADRTRYREKVRRCLDVFERMLRESAFDTDDPWTGIEVETQPRRRGGRPGAAQRRGAACHRRPRLPDRDSASSTSRLNLPPGPLADGGLIACEERLRDSLNTAEERAAALGAHQVMIGILPTLAPEHLADDAISANPRYRLLSEQILGARGEDITIDIHGVERLRTTVDTIMPEAACTSTQFHVQVSPERFASYWNAAQAIAGVQIAVGANAPYLLGKNLWAETRIPLFEQATDTRGEGSQGAGRASAGVVRRALDHLGLRPVRGERAVLPAAAAGHRRGGPAHGPGGGRYAEPLRACGCTTARSTAGTGRSTTSPVACRTYGWRTGSSPPGRPWSTRWRTPPSSSDWCARSRRTSGRCGRRCRSARPRRTSTPRPSTASTPRSTGPAWAGSRRPSSSCAGCCRWRTRASPRGAWVRRRPAGTST